MGSKSNNASLALFFLLNLLFFTFASAQCAPPPPPPPTPSPPPPRPPPPPTPSPSTGTCPIDVLKLRVCANLLGGLVSGPGTPCCALIQGLVNFEAALCLCTAIKANVLGIILDIPVALSLILNKCDKTSPTGFQCP